MSVSLLLGLGQFGSIYEMADQMVKRQKTLKEMQRLTRVRKNPEKPGTWYKDANGRWVMPEIQSEFLDWLLSLDSERPIDQQNEKQWAVAHGIGQATPASWRKNERFRIEWARRAAAKNIGVDRLQQILDMLFAKAIREDDATAASRWLGWVEKYMPPIRVERDEEVSNLSDEELESELRSLLDVQPDGSSGD